MIILLISGRVHKSPALGFAQGRAYLQVIYRKVSSKPREYQEQIKWFSETSENLIEINRKCVVNKVKPVLEQVE